MFYPKIYDRHSKINYRLILKSVIHIIMFVQGVLKVDLPKVMGKAGLARGKAGRVDNIVSFRKHSNRNRLNWKTKLPNTPGQQNVHKNLCNNIHSSHQKTSTRIVSHSQKQQVSLISTVKIVPFIIS